MHTSTYMIVLLVNETSMVVFHSIPISSHDLCLRTHTRTHAHVHAHAQTRGAFMSGRMPIRLGLQHGVIAGNQDYGLPLNESTIADKLQSVGYKTIG